MAGIRSIHGDLADPVALDLPGLGVDRDEAIGDGLVEPEGDLVGAGSPERTPLIVDLESSRRSGCRVAPLTLKGTRLGRTCSCSGS
ncbi:hypothetical protein IPP92_03645 [Candidatus Saccharibacteria bacterium]|nr:MAG: hypothetical protein IPP92_03645 [Candidatus Saccharibacteria bacterium]